MSKSCSRCDKAVYPTEELKCLDKLWHKTCFKCQTCSMALNMKTYKGFNKLPYCEAHIPKAKATTVVETPEMRRLAENTKLQSQVQYHADFEKAKGKFTQVADDPETLRIKANTKIISNVSYHGDLEKKAAMEQKRTLTGDEANGHENSVPGIYHHTSYNSRMRKKQKNLLNHLYFVSNQLFFCYLANQSPGRRAGSINDYDPVNENYETPAVLSATTKAACSSRAAAAGNATTGDATTATGHAATGSTAAATTGHATTTSLAAPAAHHRSFRAMYDYDADDDDEVSFRDGDVIVDCKPIDEGWMMGTVLRTGTTSNPSTNVFCLFFFSAPIPILRIFFCLLSSCRKP
ncbi:hypothetical protein DAPPUDRAFT_49826 [Daphnia pulex]|uniref:LIM zinc-binding domain-containing protein n=1 Tax=Daphnia pulex TaxID=6669 RepID=E9GF93_DAPPU|nr:hypothetical protein DAPPUDRAFT_49826 [Daphnia pulex]|eukprot:EFX81600.1 hypothetical protein DAPPUDRAFT_49826 [Daphnia pulex]